MPTWVRSEDSFEMTLLCEELVQGWGVGMATQAEGTANNRLNQRRPLIFIFRS